MTEKQLEKLDFKKEFYCDQVDGSEYYYFTLDIGKLCLITIQCSDEIIHKDDWSVSLFAHDDFQMNDFKTLKKFIKILKDNTYESNI